MAATLVMSQKERDGATILKEVDKGRLSAHDAAERLGLSRRQIFRLLKRYRAEGDAGLIHRLRGKSSNRGYGKRVKSRVLELYWTPKYRDYGPTLFTECLASEHNLRVNHETVRRWLMATGGTNVQRKKRPHRSKRQRRQAIGDMVLFDGSDHDWFEGRGPACTLLHLIDDAVGRAFLRFAPSENTADCMRIFRAYCERYGIPRSLYLDRGSVFFAENGTLTDFARAMESLGVTMIYANSPEAKGRVERGNRTHQDRLIKALRRKGIATIAEANRFLERHYIADHNARFALPSDGLPDVHRPLDHHMRLNDIFCFQTTRYLRRDFTITLNATYIQILKGPYALPRPTQHVIVRRYLDGALHIFHEHVELDFQILPHKPSPRKPPTVMPRADHPWRVALPIGKAKRRRRR
jgi:transposase